AADRRGRLHARVALPGGDRRVPRRGGVDPVRAAALAVTAGRLARAAVVAVVAVFAALLASGAAAGTPERATAAARPSLALVRVGEFDQPVAVAAPAGERRRLFVTERRGRIRVVRDGRLLPRPFADLSPELVRIHAGETSDQRGLLSIAFSPSYRRDGRLYAYFVDRRSHLRVDELVRDGHDAERVDPRA